MSKIRIRNFGPIQKGYLDNDGWIDVKKVTLFIGNQGSGKSTIAKLISTFSWIEKALVRGDHKVSWFEKENVLRDKFLKYHRLNNYFDVGIFDLTHIEYKGNAFQIIYKKGFLKIKEVINQNYSLPQIMYVPAERNFISYVDNPNDLKLSSDSLREFLTEFDNAKKEISVNLSIPINNVRLNYNKRDNTLNVHGKYYQVKLSESSSGFQSLVPVYLVSKYLSESVKNSYENKDSMSIDEVNRFKLGVKEIYNNDSLTDDQKRVAISVLSSKFNKTSFINIVEEPEQNLFPSSQWELLKKLIEFNNISESNQLVMTTHSPYVVNFLSICVQAFYLKEKMQTNVNFEKLNKIVPLESIIRSNELCIYQLNEVDGSIKRLSDFEGIPSDNNFLNDSLAYGNELFDKLLELEQEL